MDNIISAILGFLIISLTLFLILVLAALATPAQAQGVQRVERTGVVTEGLAKVTAQVACGAHADFVRRLSEKYGEARIWLGIVKDKSNVLEMLVSLKGTWTLLITYAEGNPGTRTCLVAEGLTWQTFAVPLPATPPGAKL